MSNGDAARLALLERFAQAWNAHDLEALMACMSEDCVFHSAAGALIQGNTFKGEREVRDGYARIFKTFPDAAWNEARHFVAGDRGVSEWRFTGTGADGVGVEMCGCDLFEFDGDRIRAKDSFRKQRT